LNNQPKPTAGAPVASRRTILVRLTQLVGPYKRTFWVAVALTLMGSLLNPLRPFLFQYTIDNPIAQGNIAGVRWWILFITGTVLLQAVLQYYQTWTTNWLGQNIMNDLRRQVFSKILSQRIQYFDKNPIGTLQTRTISDIQTLNTVFSEGFVTMIGELLQLIGIVGVMLWIDWRLTLVGLSIMPLMLLSTYVFQKLVRRAFDRVRKYVAALNAFLQEHISGMLVTQIFNREAEEYKRFKDINKKHMKAHLDTVLYYSIFFPVVEIVAALALALLVWYGAGSVLRGEVTFGVLVAFLMYIQMFFRPIRLLADQFNTLQLGIVSAERIFKVLDTDETIAEPADAAGAQVLQQAPAAIQFQDVHFAYNPGEPVLRGISFEVPAGTTTAIVGATGAGKSSVVNTLLRYYEIQQGSIRVAGHDIRQVQQDALRGYMGLVMQDVFLFGGTIAENITLFNTDIPLQRVQEAARRVGAHHFIEQLPGGYHYRVGERGATLSTGQRQLLSFIRVLVYDPKILLLDEATANIDTETEELIQQAIATVLAGRTSIIIAHRLSTIQKAQQILVMHKGEIVERGNHQQLLAQGGFYKKLYLMQYAAKQPA
jgi:ATP-binding cassette subfamily B protein